jgi:hypothetical protein
MRLLNVHTFEFRTFLGDDVPNYSIASHRWIHDEASIKDIIKKRNIESGGYQKVEGFCSYVKQANALYKDSHPDLCCDYLWIDTCCIDQKSSLEVDTAIRSMFQWYNKSVICYAYLADVEPLSVGNDRVEASFRESVWFSRGWTLQELLAPRTVVFLTKNWEVIGHKCTSSAITDGGQCPGVGHRLNGIISEITGIPELVLYDYPRSKELSIEERMSWSAQRKTTRQEDMVYCLLGIFEIHMPVMYGEGEFAQIRLRNEIEKKTEAWEKGQKAGVQTVYNTRAPCAVVKTTSHLPTVSQAAHGDLPAPIEDTGSDDDADTHMAESGDYGPDHAKAAPSQDVVDSQTSADNLTKGISGLGAQGGKSSTLSFAPGPKRTPSANANKSEDDEDLVFKPPPRSVTFNNWRDPYNRNNPGQPVRTSSWVGESDENVTEASTPAIPAKPSSAPPVPQQKPERPPIPQQQPPRPPVPRAQSQKPPVVPEEIAEEATHDETLPPPPDYDSIWDSGPPQSQNQPQPQKSSALPYQPSQATRTQSQDSFNPTPPVRSATWNPPSEQMYPPQHTPSWDSAPQEYPMPTLDETRRANSVAPPSAQGDAASNVVLSARANRRLEHAIAREERKENRREKRQERRAKRHGGGTSSSGGNGTVAGGDDDNDDEFYDFVDDNDDMLSTTGSNTSYATAQQTDRSISAPSIAGQPQQQYMQPPPGPPPRMADVVQESRRADARRRFFGGGGGGIASPTSPSNTQGPFPAPTRSSTTSSSLSDLADSLPSSLRLTRGALRMLDSAAGGGSSSNSSNAQPSGPAAAAPSEYGGSTISSVAPGTRLPTKPLGIMGHKELKQVLRGGAASDAGSQAGGSSAAAAGKKKLSPRERLLNAVANSRGA